MLKSIAIGIAAVLLIVVIGLAIAISLQPDDFSVERSATIDAPVSVVFEHVEDFRR